MRTWILRILAINLVVSAVWFGWPFLKSAKSQALDQQQRLVSEVSQRDWKQTLALMAEDYHDTWDMKREEAVSLGHEMLQSFIVLNLEWKTSSVVMEGKIATITGKIKVSGNGFGFSQEIINKVNNLQEPFVFTWRKDGWKPGDWRLVSLTQPELSGAQP
ncbi:MAG: hypothetical protein K8R87_04045 [Verrucomicrobia bacterium]|nr:hypothetical protein [Verrucomicrobiota bacterium]